MTSSISSLQSAAAAARADELAACDALEAATSAVTIAVRDWEPLRTISALRHEQTLAYRALAVATTKRIEADSSARVAA